MFNSIFSPAFFTLFSLQTCPFQLCAAIKVLFTFDLVTRWRCRLRRDIYTDVKWSYVSNTTGAIYSGKGFFHGMNKNLTSPPFFLLLFSRFSVNLKFTVLLPWLLPGAGLWNWRLFTLKHHKVAETLSAFRRGHITETEGELLRRVVGFTLVRALL